MIFPLNTPKKKKKKKKKLNFSDTETVYFPAEQKTPKGRCETSTGFHRPEPPRRASTLPPRDSLLREGVPGCVHPPWDIWDHNLESKWVKLTTLSEQALGSSNTSRKHGNGKAHHKWKFYWKKSATNGDLSIYRMVRSSIFCKRVCTGLQKFVINSSL